MTLLLGGFAGSTTTGSVAPEPQTIRPLGNETSAPRKAARTSFMDRDCARSTGPGKRVTVIQPSGSGSATLARPKSTGWRRFVSSLLGAGYGQPGQTETATAGTLRPRSEHTSSSTNSLSARPHAAWSLITYAVARSAVIPTTWNQSLVKSTWIGEPTGPGNDGLAEGNR